MRRVGPFQVLVQVEIFTVTIIRKRRLKSRLEFFFWLIKVPANLVCSKPFETHKMSDQGLDLKWAFPFTTSRTISKNVFHLIKKMLFSWERKDLSQIIPRLRWFIGSFLRIEKGGKFKGGFKLG